MLRHAETVLDALATAGDELRNPLPSGRLRVGAFSSATAALVPKPGADIGGQGGGGVAEGFEEGVVGRT
ncbi:hypothetical protein ACFYUD_35010 [Nocardia tengchongensis]|uniref:hypothetical protein n=1 Tax=Nocardia tengchongensis TaxID=2055889 RepID=UPI0036BB12C2